MSDDVTFAAVKRSLADRGFLPEVFLDAPGIVLNSGVETEAREGYVPRLLDQNLEAAVDLLDAMMATREKLRDLEILAVKAAADHALFLETRPRQLALDLAQLNRGETAAVVASEAAITLAFETGHPLSDGFAAGSRGAGTAATARAESEVAAERLLGEIAEAETRYELELFARTQAEDNAHNYAERAAVLRRALAEDAADLGARLAAIHGGFARLDPDYDGPEPPSPERGYVDDALFWLRPLVRRRNWMLQRFSTLSVTFGLCQPRGETGTAPMSHEAFREAVSAGADGQTPIVLEFTLEPADLFTPPTALLSSVGLSYSNEAKVLSGGLDVNATLDSYAQLRAKATLPDTDGPALRFGTVGVFNGRRPLAMADGVPVQNRRPFGPWRIEIDPHMIYKSVRSMLVSEGTGPGLTLTDLKLHLDLTIPSDGATS
ncbi:hypothetical protein [Roseovarius sp.]|uniref:hypothetical protein n=1 Tax=Roseovarius sp. TaxID=1486281 RepID=UPI003A97FA71